MENLTTIIGWIYLVIAAITFATSKTIKEKELPIEFWVFLILANIMFTA